MPFTVAHAAAVTPLRPFLKGKGAMTALMIGSMTPDFSYWLPAGFVPFTTHTTQSLLWFSLPIGLLSWFLWNYLLVTPVVALLPKAVRQRLQKENRAELPAGKLVALILLGAATHLLWDNFTHAYGYFVALLPPLRINYLTLFGSQLTGYKLLQHGSTVFGLLVLVAYAAVWFYRTSPGEEGEEPAGLPGWLQTIIWSLLLIPPIAVGSGFSFLVTAGPLSLSSLQDFTRTTIIVTMQISGAALILFGILWQVTYGQSTHRRWRRASYPS